MSLIEADELIRRIKADFPLEPLPETYGQPTWDGEDVTACFSGKRWDQIAAEYLYLYSREPVRDVASYLSSMSGAALRYYTPANMLMFFGDDFEKTRWIFEGLIWHLNAYNPFAPRKNKEIDPSRIECFSGFTENQKRDIADFLYHQTYFEGRTLYLDRTYDEDAKSAFDSYWHQFASQEAT